MSREGYHRRGSAWRPSASQRRVLDALTDGLTNVEIAVRLRISPETAKWHVSELLAETRLRDRSALAAWWRLESSGREDRRGLASPGGLLLKFASLVTAIMLGAVAIRLIVLDGENKGPAASSAQEQPAPVVEVADPVPPALQPDVWIFDVRNRTALPVPVSLSVVQWYNPGEALIARAGKLHVILDLQGKVLDHFAQEPEGPYIYASSTPVYGKGALIWRWGDATLSFYDVAQDREQLMLSLEPATAPRQIDLQVSPDRTRLAYTQVGADAVSLVLADVDGSNAVTVLSLPGNDEIYIEGWSPDSRHLLIATGTRTDCRPNGRFDVCTLADPATLALDMAGNVVWQDDNRLWRTHWAGPGKLLVEDGTLAEHLMASRGVDGVCETSESTPGGQASCLYTVSNGETLESIAARFGIEPGEQVFEVTASGWLPLLGEAPQLTTGDVLSIPAPLQGSLIDLETGDVTMLDVDVRGLLCVSPDGDTAIIQYTRGSLDDYANRFHLAAVDLQSGETIVETQVAHGLITCTDRSWTPDGSQVVLSSWGK